MTCNESGASKKTETLYLAKFRGFTGNQLVDYLFYPPPYERLGKNWKNLNYLFDNVDFLRYIASCSGFCPQLNEKSDDSLSDLYRLSIFQRAGSVD